MKIILNSCHPFWRPTGDFHVCIRSVLQSCPALCNPMDCSRPGSSVHGILQTRVLEWVVISFSRGSSPPRDWTHVSCIAGRFFTNERLGKLHVVLSDYKAICYNQFSWLFAYGFRDVSVLFSFLFCFCCAGPFLQCTGFSLQWLLLL